MSNSQAEVKIPAPLLALGGWADAEWFSTSVLSDTEVVGLTFPKLAGLRKQRFDVIDRSLAAASGRPGQQVKPAEPPRTLAGRLAQIFDSYGATRAVACSRNRLLFEGSPVLFFAEIPLAKIKQRAANKLRRELIEHGLRCCVVHLDHVAATAMVWPDAEPALTAFVEAASPEHAIHAEFDAPARRTDPARDDARQKAREAKLLREVAALREQIGTLQRAQSALGAMEQLGLDDARLKSMLKLLHPDKHGGSAAANDAAQWLNGLRDLLRKSPA